MGKLSLKLFNPNSRNEKLHPQGDGVFGHGEWGMGQGEEVPNAQCPMPQAVGRLSLYRQLGMEFPAAFDETSKQQCLIHRLRYASGYTQRDSGFSLIELVVVMLMIGILSAIAAPGWVGFMNRQKVNKANDAIFAALQEAQREAKNKKLSYSVSFRKISITQNVEVAIYRTDIGISTWKPLSSDVGVNSDKFLLGGNLSGENIANSTNNSPVSYPVNTSYKITFDYMGTLPNANFGTFTTPFTEAPGLKIAVAIPTAANSASASRVKRCVIVKTLLGSMLTAKDEKCD